MKNCVHCNELIPDIMEVCPCCHKPLNVPSPQPAINKNNTVKSIYCIKCGTQLPSEANYCWKCGKPQQEGLNISDLDNIVWENCMITYEVVYDGGKWSLSSDLARWIAKASGPKGNYLAGASSNFKVMVSQTHATKGMVLLASATSIDQDSQLEYIKAVSLLDELINKLILDGWELIASSAQPFWSRHFRRRVK